MAPLTEMSNPSNRRITTERRRHSTQPSGKLVPARMELVDGEPQFYYNEETPVKQVSPPKIECCDHGEEDEENKSIVSKSGSVSSSVASSIRGALKGFARRHHNRKNKEQQPRNLVKIKFKRRSSHASSAATQSCTEVDDSSTSNVLSTEMTEPVRAATEAAEPSMAASTKRESQIESTDVPVPSIEIPSPRKETILEGQEEREEPEPIPTLKAALEQLQNEPTTTRSQNSKASSDASQKSSSISTSKSTSEARSNKETTTNENEDPKSKSKDAKPSRRLSTSNSTTSSQSQHPHYANFKIFMLLLDPGSKTFELIQLFFNPSITTIRDVLQMIPANATEPALGQQTYTALCRPNSEDQEEEEISDLNLLVQNHDNMKLSAMIVRGEILVAVPEGYTARKVAMLSQQILVNPRIRRLLESSDPLATSKSQKLRVRKVRRRRRVNARTPPNRRIKEVEVLERHDEEPSSQEEQQGPDSSMMLVQKALENAASAAAAANAAILREHHQLVVPQHQGQSLVAAAGKTYRYPHGRNANSSDLPTMWSPSSATDTSMSVRSALHSLDNSYTDYAYEEGDSSYSLGSYSARSVGGNSRDNSYTSWSKSLDTSFAGQSVYSLRVGADTPVSQLTNATMMSGFGLAVATTPTTNGKRRSAKQMRMIRRAVVGAFAALVVTYYMDTTNGYATRHDRMQGAQLEILGISGIIRVVFMLLVFAKLQFLCKAEPISSPAYLNKACKCPFMRMRASAMSSSN